MFARKLLGCLALLSFTQMTFADPRYGAGLTIPLITKDPPQVGGARGNIWYQPSCLLWKKASLYFDASYAHWYLTRNRPNRNIDIVALAPIFRMYFTKNNCFSVYFESSVGVAYQSKIYFGPQKLGMNFSFQDMAALGARIGHTQQFTVSLNIMHYSNASLNKCNSGITIPLLLNIGYGV